MKYISSAQNSQIKKVKGLQEKTRKRSESSLFVIEGVKELVYALEAGYILDEIYLTDSKRSIETESVIGLIQNKDGQLYELSDALFKTLCYRSTSDILGICFKKKHDLTELTLKENSLILIAESPEKPGNIGALARTVDAANIDALIIIDPKTDLYNPNVIRSSVGCLFSIPIAIATQNEVFNLMESKNIKLFSAALSEKSKSYIGENYTSSTAIAVGTEHKGLSDSWLRRSENHIVIQMQGVNDSLNVSVAAGVILFEAVRQRNL